MATKIGNGFKLVNGPGGKTKLVPNKKARMAKLDVSTRLKAEHKAKTKIRYKGKFH
jgi:hypothetical protein